MRTRVARIGADARGPSVDANAFFLRQLPTLIVGDLNRFASLTGRVALSVGAAKFTVRLGDLEAPVVEGFDRAAEVKVWFFGDAFARFLAGAVLAGPRDVRVEGDREVLGRFGQLLSPARNALSIRCG
jgi:hypothetical protein